MRTFDFSPLVDSANDPPFVSLIGDAALARRFRLLGGVEEFFWSEHRLAIRTLAGARMTTAAALFGEFEAALQLPFLGHNWDALDDWLPGLWFPPGAGFVFLVTDASHVLEGEPEARSIMLEILRDAARASSRPITKGVLRGQPAVPFHFVLAGADEARIAETWGTGIPRICEIEDARPEREF